MRKSVTVLFVIGELILLFVFANISSMVNHLGNLEQENIRSEAEKVAAICMLLIENGQDPQAAGKPYFSSIRFTGPSRNAARIDRRIGRIRVIRTLDRSRAVVFSKNINMVSVQAVDRLAGIFRSLIFLLGGLLILTMIYLVYQFRRSRNTEPRLALDPFQDYLSRLKDSETSLRDTVAQQQEKVSHQQELNRIIISNMEGAILLVSPDGRVQIFSGGAKEIFNVSYAGAVNNPVKKVLQQYPLLAERITKPLDRRVSCLVRDSNRTFRLDLAPVGKQGTLAVVRDITLEVKRSEIRRNQENFARLGEMAAYLTHEVRNSLGAVYGYSKTLSGDEQKVARINSEILHVTDMMQRFLDYARPLEVKNPQPVDIGAALAEECGRMNVSVFLPKNPQVVKGDPGLIKSLWSNLINNAVQAGATEIRLISENTGPGELMFTDNGQGIPRENLEKVWFPFFTTEEKGSGMGLPLVRKIMAALDGDIRIEKSDARGTVMRLVFFCE